MWEYRAQVQRVVDGDTIDVVTDLGFGLKGLAMRLRLLGVDAYEARDPGGLEATKFTEDWIRTNRDAKGYIMVNTVSNGQDRDKSDSFGRYLAMVWDMSKHENLNMALIAAGHAVTYDKT